MLLVEDEPRMANVVAKGLREHAYAVDVAGAGESAIYRYAINEYDFILLDLVVETAIHRVTRCLRQIDLTSKEYALLEYLARHAGRIVSRSEIAEHVWDGSFDPFSNTIEVYVNHLRRKIDDQHVTKLIHTR